MESDNQSTVPTMDHDRTKSSGDLQSSELADTSGNSSHSWENSLTPTPKTSRKVPLVYLPLPPPFLYWSPILPIKSSGEEKLADPRTFIFAREPISPIQGQCFNCLEMGHRYKYCPFELAPDFCCSCGFRYIVPETKCGRCHKQWAVGRFLESREKGSTTQAPL